MDQICYCLGGNYMKSEEKKTSLRNTFCNFSDEHSLMTRADFDSVHSFIHV